MPRLYVISQKGDSTSTTTQTNLIDIEAFDSRFVGSRGTDELPVVGNLDPAADGRHLEVLDQLNPSPELDVFLQNKAKHLYR